MVIIDLWIPAIHSMSVQYALEGPFSSPLVGYRLFVKTFHTTAKPRSINRECSPGKNRKGVWAYNKV